MTVKIKLLFEFISGILLFSLVFSVFVHYAYSTSVWFFTLRSHFASLLAQFSPHLTVFDIKRPLFCLKSDRILQTFSKESYHFPAGFRTAAGRVFAFLCTFHIYSFIQRFFASALPLSENRRGFPRRQLCIPFSRKRPFFIRSVLFHTDDADLNAQRLIHLRDRRANSAFGGPVRQEDDLYASLRVALPLLHH